MKRTGILMLAALALTFAAACDDDNATPAGPSNTGPIIFTAQLSAANEVPPVAGSEANARGSVTATFNVPRDTAGNITGGGTVTFSMQASGFAPNTPIVGAHIHPGATGVNGGVVVNSGLSAAAPLVLADGTGSLTVQNITITQDLATQITANPAGYYFNIHSPTNPGGAARGQLTRTQ
jgi:hypothetical protein